MRLNSLFGLFANAGAMRKQHLLPAPLSMHARLHACRLKHENIIITSQRPRHAYRFDPASGTFVEDPGSATAPLGSGYSLCQLAWMGDAVTVGKDGTLAVVEGTVMERFAAQGVE